MRFLLLLLITAAAVSGFCPAPTTRSTTTTTARLLESKLYAERRDVLVAAGMGWMFLASRKSANAAGSTFFVDDRIEDLRPQPSQMATGGKVDLNSAFVDEYKQFPGFFPHAAGKIASNGPYESVKDIYKIKGLTKNDLALFKKFENEFTVNPPGRSFGERINARVSV